MGRNGIDLKQSLQANYKRLIELKMQESISKGLTKQLIINFNRGEIDNIREGNIIAGATVVDFYMSAVVN